MTSERSVLLDLPTELWLMIMEYVPHWDNNRIAEGLWVFNKVFFNHNITGRAAQFRNFRNQDAIKELFWLSVTRDDVYTVKALVRANRVDVDKEDTYPVDRYNNLRASPIICAVRHRHHNVLKYLSGICEDTHGAMRLAIGNTDPTAVNILLERAVPIKIEYFRNVYMSRQFSLSRYKFDRETTTVKKIVCSELSHYGPELLRQVWTYWNDAVCWHITEYVIKELKIEIPEGCDNLIVNNVTLLEFLVKECDYRLGHSALDFVILPDCVDSVFQHSNAQVTEEHVLRAFKKSDFKMIRKLMQYVDSPAKMFNAVNGSALVHHAKNASVSDVKAIIHYGLEIGGKLNFEATDEQGCSALHIAAFQQRDYDGKHDEIVSLFLDYPDIDINVTSIFGQSLLDIYVAETRYTNNIQMVKKIMAHPKFDRNLCQKAMFWVASLEMAELLKPFVDFTATDHKGNTLIHYAADPFRYIELTGNEDQDGLKLERMYEDFNPKDVLKLVEHLREEFKLDVKQRNLQHQTPLEHVTMQLIRWEKHYGDTHEARDASDKLAELLGYEKVEVTEEHEDEHYDPFFIPMWGFFYYGEHDPENCSDESCKRMFDDELGYDPQS